MYSKVNRQRRATAMAAAVCLAALSACGGGGDDAPAASGLSALYGRLTLNYRFNSSATVFTDTATFSSGSLSADGKTIAAATVVGATRMMGCSLNTTAAFPYAYLCVILDSSFGTTELFAFNFASNRVTNGLYEYCVAGTSVDVCTADLIATPDGTLLNTSGIFAADRAQALDAKQARGEGDAKRALAAGQAAGPTALPPGGDEWAALFERLRETAAAAAPRAAAER